MKAVNHLSPSSYSDPVQNFRADGARVVLLVTADSALSHRLIRALNGDEELSRSGEEHPYQVPIARSVAQARTGIGHVAPAVILLDESIGAPNLFTYVVQDLAKIAPVVFLAAPESLARWCAQEKSSELVAQGRVECVARHGDFVPLAARLIERHAGAHSESPRPYGRSSVLATMRNRMEVDPEGVPLDFGEVLRHEVNNPLTGILGNAELLLSHRDRLSTDMIDRLEVIADLAIRLRETVRRLSNALERRTARVPASPSDDLTSSHRHRPPT